MSSKYSSTDFNEHINFYLRNINMLSDNISYSKLYSIYANVQAKASAGFDSDKGAGIASITLNIIYRKNKALENQDITNLYIKYKGKYFKVTTLPINIDSATSTITASLQDNS